MGCFLNTFYWYLKLSSGTSHSCKDSQDSADAQYSKRPQQYSLRQTRDKEIEKCLGECLEPTFRVSILTLVM